MSPTIHLICGATGAGKTTYARALSRSSRTPTFSIDDWMATLFGPDTPATPDWLWIMTRVARCETQILKTAIEVGCAGMDAILDIGLLRAGRRREIADGVALNRCAVKLHFLDVDANERWRRVNARNDEHGETYRFTVTRPMFDFIETIWQPPTPAELVALNGQCVAAGDSSA